MKKKLLCIKSYKADQIGNVTEGKIYYRLENGCIYDDNNRRSFWDFDGLEQEHFKSIEDIREDKLNILGI